MKRLALCLVALAACKKDHRSVPAEFQPMVPTKGLDYVVTPRKDQPDPFNQGNMLTMFYGNLAVDELRGAFRDRLAALDGYQPMLDCGADNGFNLIAVKPPRSIVEVDVGRLGSDGWKAELTVDEATWIGLPDEPGCAWLAAAKTLCTDPDDAPDRCTLGTP